MIEKGTLIKIYVYLQLLSFITDKLLGFTVTGRLKNMEKNAAAYAAELFLL